MKAPIVLPLVLGITASVSASGSDLLISQYVEGSNSNKALELYNPTTESVSLSGYTISVYNNGGLSASSIVDLSGSIAPGGTLVIAQSGAEDALKALADLDDRES